MVISVDATRQSNKSSTIHTKARHLSKQVGAFILFCYKYFFGVSLFFILKYLFFRQPPILWMKWAQPWTSPLPPDLPHQSMPKERMIQGMDSAVGHQLPTAIRMVVIMSLPLPLFWMWMDLRQQLSLLHPQHHFFSSQMHISSRTLWALRQCHLMPTRMRVVSPMDLAQSLLTLFWPIIVKII